MQPPCNCGCYGATNRLLAQIGILYCLTGTEKHRCLTLKIQCEELDRYAVPARWSSSEQLPPCDHSPGHRSQTDGWRGNLLRWRSNHLPRSSGCAPSPRRCFGRRAMLGSGCHKQWMQQYAIQARFTTGTDILGTWMVFDGQPSTGYAFTAKLHFSTGDFWSQLVTL